MSKSHDLWVQLVKILNLIASPAQTQLASYGDNVIVADEIALDFDDMFIRLPELMENSDVPVEFYEILTTINSRFSSMSPIKNIWTDEALQHSQHWEELRILAANALVLLKAC